jgi:phage tail tape-measure protein
MRQARAWFTAKCKVKSYDELLQLAPGGSEENASLRMVTTYWDLAASFMTSGVLNKELFFQSGRELLLVWERVRDYLPSMREAYKDPSYLKHLETIGNEFAAHFKSQDKTAYEAFLKRIK